MRLILIVSLLALLNGCASHQRHASESSASPASGNAPELVANRDVEAYVDPPSEWRADPLKQSRTHKHQVWISPTGRTAYGVIHFTLPLPVGHDLALWGFLQEMKRVEGEAVLRSKQWDKNLDGLRFVADGGLYHVRVNLLVDGWEGWAVYAGAKRNEPLMITEMELAEQAREHTAVGLKPQNRR